MCVRNLFLVNTAILIYFKRREKNKDFHQWVYLKGSKLNKTMVITADV